MKNSLNLLIILFALVNCNAQKNCLKEKDYLILNKFEINDNRLIQLINQSIDNYKKKFNEPPKIIEINFLESKESNSINFNITNRLYLFSDENEKSLIGNKFLAYGKINKIPILLNNIGYDFKKMKKYFKIHGKVEKYKVVYGNSINYCTQEFNIINDKIEMLNSYCSYDMVVK